MLLLESGESGRWLIWVLGIDPGLPCPSVQVSAGSVYPALARLTVKGPPPGSSGFLSIEPQDLQPPRVGDNFILNLRTVGIEGPTFSHYYYMVCGTWGIGLLV